jgi:hypothetical protein
VISYQGEDLQHGSAWSVITRATFRCPGRCCSEIRIIKGTGHEREVMVEAKPICEPLYTVNEVAPMLKMSRDTVIRQFGTLPGVFDQGHPERRHKRRYRVLRIPRSVLLQYLDERRIRATS